VADIRIKDLPLATGPTAPTGTDFVAIDGLTTRKTSITTLGDVAVPVASQAESEAGVNAVKRMTPLTTKQSIASEVGVTLASKAQGDLADSALQPGDAATPAQGGKADTAVQPVDNRELSFNNKIAILGPRSATVPDGPSSASLAAPASGVRPSIAAARDT